jgi:hypothetical protein
MIVLVGATRFRGVGRRGSIGGCLQRAAISFVVAAFLRQTARRGRTFFAPSVSPNESSPSPVGLARLEFRPDGRTSITSLARPTKIVQTNA